MKKDNYVFVFIPTFNDINTFDITLDSVLNQNYDRRLLRIVVIDNASTDGTYLHILRRVVENKDIMGVYQIRQSVTKERLGLKMTELLKYMPRVDYSTMLKPGTILYPNFVKTCVETMNMLKHFEGSTLLCEVDCMKDKNRFEQIPIYNNNFIIKDPSDRHVFLNSGFSHSIQPFYRGFGICLTTPLSIETELRNYNSWTNKFWSHGGDIIYLKEPLACVESASADEYFDILMAHYRLLKRSYLPVEVDTAEIPIDNPAFLKENREKSYKELSKLALRYAYYSIRDDNYKMSCKCFLLSEVICDEIVNSNEYKLLHEYMDGKAILVDNLFEEDAPLITPVGTFEF